MISIRRIVAKILISVVVLLLKKKTKKEPEKQIETEPREGICASCKKKCTASGAGCSEYQKLWTENWNRNIHRKKPEPERPRARQFFLYEHPDLIREGIVFTGGNL